jgi:multidrug efflux pump subunit AcrB
VAFTFLYQTGNTFNFLVLFSLILGLGLLVDTTIVIMEGMHENLYRHKMTPINAALNTVKTYRFSLMSGMLTTIAAFLPMYLMSGIMGQFFKFIPTTVNAVLISAFIIGLFIIPAYAVMAMHRIKSNEKEANLLKKLRCGRETLVECVNRRYKKVLHFLLDKKKRRRIFLGATVGIFMSALALPILGFVKVEGFPLVENDFMWINIEAPVGVTLDRLDPIVRRIEEVVQQDENIESYVVNLGVGGTQSLEGDLAGASASTHLASMTLNFVEEDERTKPSFLVAEEYKDRLSFITEATITVPELRSGPPTGSAIQVLVFGDDYSILQNISADIRAKLKEFGGAQVDDNIATSTAEFTFDFSSPYSKAVLKNSNLSVVEVTQEVRMAVFPTEAATIKRGEDEIDINVQRDWGGYKPTSIDAVKQIQVQNNLGEYISLGSLALPEIGASLTSINHFDSEQAITIGADVEVGKVPAEVLGKLVPYLDSYQWPEGYSYQLTGGNEDTEQSFRDLFNAMFLGLLLIFLILVTQFNSFKQPFVILMSLPLSLIGVLYGFMIFRLNVGVATMIGIVALSGIVINDSIILIDRINHNRRHKGMPLKEAIMEAGPARLQPIVITSVTTILGILPISLTDAFWLTLGMAIVFGMAFATVLTLLIIPVFYYSTELRAERKRVKAQ